MCAYCGCADFEVVGRFMAEHEHIINHLSALRRLARRRAPAARSGARTEAHLTPHVVAEEAGLFTIMARDEVFTDHIARLCGEHHELDEPARGRGGW